MSPISLWGWSVLQLLTTIYLKVCQSLDWALPFPCLHDAKLGQRMVVQVKHFLALIWGSWIRLALTDRSFGISGFKYLWVPNYSLHQWLSFSLLCSLWPWNKGLGTHDLLHHLKSGWLGINKLLWACYTRRVASLHLQGFGEASFVHPWGVLSLQHVQDEWGDALFFCLPCGRFSPCCSGRCYSLWPHGGHCRQMTQEELQQLFHPFSPHSFCLLKWSRMWKIAAESGGCLVICDTRLHLFWTKSVSWRLTCSQFILRIGCLTWFWTMESFPLSMCLSKNWGGIHEITFWRYPPMCTLAKMGWMQPRLDGLQFGHIFWHS